jgi:hypothetical protein
MSPEDSSARSNSARDATSRLRQRSAKHSRAFETPPDRHEWTTRRHRARNNQQSQNVPSAREIVSLMTIKHDHMNMADPVASASPVAVVALTFALDYSIGAGPAAPPLRTLARSRPAEFLHTLIVGSGRFSRKIRSHRGYVVSTIARPPRAPETAADSGTLCGGWLHLRRGDVGWNGR